MTNFSTDKSSNQTQEGFSMPLAGAMLMAFLGAIVVGSSFYVISFCPLPASVAPVMGFKGGACWGAVVGALAGLVLGFLTDEKHFD
jgi:hypothetical protein